MEALAAVQRVGESGWLILGSEVEKFEMALAEFWGMQAAVGCGNGMDAIEISLRSAGLQAGERVLTTPWSAFATTLAILRAGGRPVYVDVDASGMLDLEAVRTLLEEQREIRWMVPVHLFGQCLDLEELARLRDEFGLKIVEDCAQSIGARWNTQVCGSVGVAAATSFYPTKNLGALGDGGALLTNDPALAAAARQWRNYGQSEKYLHALPGLNSRLDEVHAAILHDALLPRLERFTRARCEVARHYRMGLNHPLISLLPISKSTIPVHHLFPIFVAEHRPHLMEHLHRQGVATGIHYPLLIPDQAALQGQPTEGTGALPVARRLAAQELSLPIHPHLTLAQCQQVIEACNSWTP